MKYDVNYFINKFEAIPEEKWCSGQLNKENGQKCALGHCGMMDSVRPTKESTTLAALLREYLNLVPEDHIDWVFYTVYPVNDGLAYRYKQPTPRTRILAALYDIRKMQTVKDTPTMQVPLYEDITASLAQLPADHPETDLVVETCKKLN